MKSIISVSLWTIGVLYFLVLFCIIVPGMILFSTKTIYPAVRVLARTQLLAKEAKADILPFASIGLYEFNNKNSWHLHPQTVSVAFGKPISYASFKDFTIDTLKEYVRKKIIELKTLYR